MTDVIIRRFNLRIVRRGSLFWQGDPRSLARKAIAILPEMLANCLVDIDISNFEDIEITKPVQLHISGTFSQLTGMLGGKSTFLQNKLINSLKQVLTEDDDVVQHRVRVKKENHPIQSMDNMLSITLFNELLQVHLRGQLFDFLAQLSESRLEAYHFALLEQPARTTRRSLALLRDNRNIFNFIQGVAAQIETDRKQQPNRTDRIKERLFAAISLAASTGISPFEHATRDVIDCLIPQLYRERTDNENHLMRDQQSTAYSNLQDFIDLHLQGKLLNFFAGLSANVLEYHHQNLLEGTASTKASRTSTSGEQETKSFIENFARQQKVNRKHHPPDYLARLKERLLAAISLAASTGYSPFDPVTRSALDLFLPCIAKRPFTAKTPALYENKFVPEAIFSQSPPPPFAKADLGTHVIPIKQKIILTMNPLSLWERVRVRDLRFETGFLTHFSLTLTLSQRERGLSEKLAGLSVSQGEHPAPLLPFLVASYLFRKGILTNISKYLIENGLGEGLPLWIAALVFKLGPQPERGWMLPSACYTHAALLSGANLFTSESLVHFADSASKHWAHLSKSLVADFVSADSPLLIAKYNAQAVALLSLPSFAPVWVGSLEALPLPTTRGCPENSEVRQTLASLSSRPACTMARSPLFDYLITAACGWALAQMGQRLWPNESPSALLMLNRFASLEAQVRRNEDNLSLRIPLGKRQSDLHRAGLLTDLPRVNWLTGGGIRFRGG